MRHYRMSIADIRKLTSSDQRDMIQALIDEPLASPTLHFETEADYAAWKKKNAK